MECSPGESVPVYDLIIGKETMHELGVILDFKEKTIRIDEILLPMRNILNLQLKPSIIGVLKWQPSSRWASSTFIIPKKDGTVRTISDFRELNKHIVRKPYPIPQISTTLQELEGFTYATALDLNMGYYTIRLDA